jgi:hypothetical protein
MLSVGNDELGEPLGAEHFCEKCQTTHEVKTQSILNFVNCRGTTFLIGIKGQRIKTSSHREEAASSRLDREALGARARDSKYWGWRDGMRVLRWSPGLPDHLAYDGRVGCMDRAFLTSTCVPDLYDPATQGALLSLIREHTLHINSQAFSPIKFNHRWGMGYFDDGVWVWHVQPTHKTEVEALLEGLETL